MKEIVNPMNVRNLQIQPPITGKMQLSEDMQQTFALMAGYCDNERVVLRSSQQGVLSVASAPIKTVLHFTGSGDNDTQQGTNYPCSEVMIMGHPDNSGRVWVRNAEIATVNNAWPLKAEAVISFTVNNLSQIQFLFVTDGDKAIVAVS